MKIRPMGNDNRIWVAQNGLDGHDYCPPKRIEQELGLNTQWKAR